MSVRTDPVTAGADLARFLRLDRLERDVFRGWCHLGAPGKAFGGQVAAQALAAAGRTVEAGRAVHSLHGYFLSAGDLTRPVIYRAERLRDGRSYSARRVTALQDDRPIFTLSASFKSSELTPERQQGMPDVPPPESLLDPYPRWAANSPDEYAAAEYRRVISMRVPHGAWTGRRLPLPGVNERLVWIKATEALPDEPLLQACALTYASDLTLAPTAALDHEAPRVERAGPPQVLTASLDHSMWFHRPFRADEWMLFAVRSPSAGDGRGLATGQVWGRDGTLIASLAQEAVVRPLQPAHRNAP